MKKKEYKRQLRRLQEELVKLQRHVIARNERVVAVFEGRDAAGKDGTIKRITQHLSPRETRVVALGKPTERDETAWYFQRYVPYLPAAQEIVLFNRSWYNRAGVEKVMGFCSEEQYGLFMQQAPEFERMLVDERIHLFKFYLDISRDEQERRLEDRFTNPLKAWKISPIDAVALEHWGDYSSARNTMFTETHRPWAPWVVVDANDKQTCRLNVIKYLIAKFDYEGRDDSLALPDLDRIFEYDVSYLEKGVIHA